MDTPYKMFFKVIYFLVDYVFVDYDEYCFLTCL